MSGPVYVACMFDDCEAHAAHAITAHWPDGEVLVRSVCPAHVTRGIQALQDFRPEAGEPTIMQSPVRHEH